MISSAPTGPQPPARGLGPTAGIGSPPPPGRRAGRWIAGTAIVVLVVGLFVAAGVLAARELGKDDDDDGGRREERAGEPGPGTTAAPSSTVPTNPVALDALCPAEPAMGRLPEMPAQPARVEGGPGQHALLVSVGAFGGSAALPTVVGNLDTAPGGGFELGHTEASDAKTVLLVCAYGPEAVETGVDCAYFENGNMLGPAHEVRLARARHHLSVYDVRTGTVLGTGELLGPELGECPDETLDYRDGVLEVPATSADLVAWAQAHLVGARLG